MYIKDFLSWTKNKIDLNKDSKENLARYGEVRWAAVGVNIGSEIDGKNDNFTRPVYIVSAAGPDLCLVIPMSSKLKNVSGYFEIEVAEEKVSLCVHQMRVISKKRILGRIENLSSNKQNYIKKIIKQYYNL